VRPAILRGGLIVLGVGIVAAVVALMLIKAPELPITRTGEGPTRTPEMLAWREPDADIARFFPGANAHREETRILSAQRLELIRRLGREPTAEEHLPVIHRITRDGKPLGVVMVRRVKGEAGSIEVVIAVDPERRVKGVRLQRQREPKEAAAVLTSAEWLKRFEGKRPGDTIPDAAPAAAKASAQELVRGVRDALVVLDLAERKGVTAAHH
jgi:hypothetical protein